MPAHTKKLGLSKPYGSEYYDVGTWNTNMDIIDEAFDGVTDNLTARKISYDGSQTGLPSNVQQAIDHLADNVNTTASKVSYEDNAGIGCHNVQTAIDYLAENTSADAINVTYEDVYGIGCDNVQDAIDYLADNTYSSQDDIGTLQEKMRAVESGAYSIRIQSVDSMPTSPETGVLYLVQGKVRVG